MTIQSSTLPLVTIGITCYNASDTIQSALTSVIDQDYPFVDIIIIDDCSSDNSFEIIQDFSSDCIRTYRNSFNRGASYTRNLILNYALGDLICFVDDDDIIHASRISLQVDRMISSGFPDNFKLVSVPSMTRRYASGYVRLLPSLGLRGRPPTSKEMIDYLFFKKQHRSVDYGFCAPSCAFMLSTSFAKTSGGFDSSLRRVEDVDFVIRLCFNGATFIGLPDYLISQNSTVGDDKNAFVNYLSELCLVDKYRDYLHSVSMYRYSRLSVKLRFAYFSKKFLLFLRIFVLLFSVKPVYTIATVTDSSLRRLLHEFRNFIGF